MGKKSKRKKRRMSQEKRDYLERAGYQNEHHILSKEYGGTREKENMIRLDERRHSAYHLVFHNITFLQAAKLLIRTHNMKKGTNFRIVEEG